MMVMEEGTEEDPKYEHIPYSLQSELEKDRSPGQFTGAANEFQLYNQQIIPGPPCRSGSRISLTELVRKLKRPKDDVVRRSGFTTTFIQPTLRDEVFIPRRLTTSTLSPEKKRRLTAEKKMCEKLRHDINNSTRLPKPSSNSSIGEFDVLQNNC
ncbi:hypothetical protein ACHWQZ_G003119 [Mnemiopsis leidyi]